MREKSILQLPRITSSALTDDTVIVEMTAAMVPKVASLHMSALAGSRTADMGEAYVRVFIDWFRRADHGGVALVAIDRYSEVLGYVIGAPLGYARDLSRYLAWTAAGAVIVRPWLFFKLQFRKGFLDRLQLLLGHSLPQTAQPELPAPTLSLVALGVSPTARGKRIGSRLVQAFEAKARELQMQSLRLSTRSDNVVARRLYEGCGWRPFPLSDENTYFFRILDEHSEATDKQ